MNEQPNTDEHWDGACGAGIFHAVGQATLGGRCSNCGSYELVPLSRSWSAAARTA